MLCCGVVWCLVCATQALAHMPLSLHSMEVVNKLTASGCLPAEVVHVYISNCINSCDDVPVSSRMFYCFGHDCFDRCCWVMR